MGANEKLAAVGGPWRNCEGCGQARLASTFVYEDGLCAVCNMTAIPVGENPGLPPFMGRGRSGAAAVFSALAATDAAVKHAENLQAAVNEIRALTETEYTAYPLLVIRNILERHQV